MTTGPARTSDDKLKLEGKAGGALRLLLLLQLRGLQHPDVNVAAPRALLQMMFDLGKIDRGILSGHLLVDVLGDQLEDGVAIQLIVSRGIDLSNPLTKGFKLQGMCLLVLVVYL
jgi:hypothetical protein